VDLVGVPLLDQGLDDLDHVVDVIGSARVQVGPLDPHEAGVQQERVGVLLRDLERREPLVGLGELHLVATGVRDLVGHVSDVGDVHDPADPEPLEPERAADQVAQHERPHVPDVDVPVHGRTARVDLHRLPVDGGDVVELTGEGVVQAPDHARIPSTSKGRYGSGGVSGRRGACPLPSPEGPGPVRPPSTTSGTTTTPSSGRDAGTSIGSRSPSSAMRTSISSPTSSSRSSNASRTPSTTWRFFSRRFRTLSRQSFRIASISLRRSASESTTPIGSVSPYGPGPVAAAEIRLRPIPYTPTEAAAVRGAFTTSGARPED